MTWKNLMSEISKIYGQYHDSLKVSQDEYEQRIKIHSKLLKERYDNWLKNFIVSFSNDFANQIQRLEIKSIAEQFFGTSEIQFVAIDASCDKRQSNNFISFYGGAYGSKGRVSLDDPSGKIRYQRWEMNKDVSMVAFVPLPPDVMQINIDTEENESITSMSDSEIAEVSSLHTKIMQLAEVYLAYSLANASSIDKPNLILIDNGIGGILANSSFSPKNVGLENGDFDGQYITVADMQIALAHPFNKQLQLPSTKKFQPHFRLIAEAVWNESSKIKATECKDFPLENFQGAAKFLSGSINAGTYDKNSEEFTFNVDPRTSWKKTISIFESICEKIFKEKSAEGITYKLKNSKTRQYLSSSDLKFLIGVGIRALIENCWKRNILLIGIVKDSMSRFFYRNFLGSICMCNGEDPYRHLSIPLTDRNIIELLPNIDPTIKAPWSSIEFDACFMTLHPEKDKTSNKWIIKGYDTTIGETTRPERIMLRSIGQFFISEDGNIASHAIFIDRLTYPQWDDKDSLKMPLPTSKWGDLLPFYFQKDKKISRLQKLSMYLLTVLIKNHYPEALGYPDPLHQADWGAKSMKNRILGLLDSSEWAFRSRPLTKTFREIRDSYR